MSHLSQRSPQVFYRRFQDLFLLFSLPLLSFVFLANASEAQSLSTKQSAYADRCDFFIEQPWADPHHPLFQLSTAAGAAEPPLSPDFGGTDVGVAWVYPKGPLESELEPVCLRNLGIYDPDTGDKVESNGGHLTGKYLETDTLTFGDHGGYDWDPIPPLQSDQHDFRIHPEGDEFSSNQPDRRAALVWSSEVHSYYYIDDYRRRILNDGFINELDLDPEIEKNLKTRQFRPDLYMDGEYAVEEKPVLLNFESMQVFGFDLFPISNIFRAPFRTRGPQDPYDQLEPLSLSFDPEALVGDYATLAAFWVLGDNEGWPTQAGFGSGDSWQNNTLAAVHDGLGAWTGYRYSGDDEVYNYFSYAIRMWGETHDPGSDICNEPDTFDCDKGHKIKNVMMFDETQDHKNGLFPFFYLPEGYSNVMGPKGSEAAALYIAALFYDISVEVGLGDRKADLLFWKTISLLDDNDYLPMRKFGQTIQQAARELWPLGDGAESIYEEDIRQVLLSRGIAVDDPIGEVPIGEADFTASLPEAVGPTLLDVELLTSHPNLHPYVNSYGAVWDWTDEYTHESEEEVYYVSYRFYKHSKYGPCDFVEFQLPDGTYDSDGVPNPDGTTIWQGQGRDFGNKTVFVPGDTLRIYNERARCENEAEGYYSEDVWPFGYRIVEATANGFSFHVERIGDMQYEFSIVDPSVDIPELGAAEYSWTFKDRYGNTVQDEGTTATYTAPENEPITIVVERERDGKSDILEINERANDLDRQSGDAFVSDTTNL